MDVERDHRHRETDDDVACKNPATIGSKIATTELPPSTIQPQITRHFFVSALSFAPAFPDTEPLAP